jgi:hypothetical protein
MCGFIINRRFGGLCRLHLQGRKNSANDKECQTTINRLTTLLRHWKHWYNLGGGKTLLDVNGQQGSGFERLHTQVDLSHSSLAAGLPMVNHIAGTGILLQRFLEGGDKRFPSLKTKLNSMVWVRERTIPTERPPLVSEVIAHFCGERVPRGQSDGSLRPYSWFSRQEPPLFYQVASQLYSWGWVDPVPDPLPFVLFFLVVPGIEPGPPDL